MLLVETMTTTVALTSIVFYKKNCHEVVGVASVTNCRYLVGGHIVNHHCMQ